MFNLTVVLAAGLVGGLLGQHLRHRGIEPRVVPRPIRVRDTMRAMTAILVLDVGTSTLRAAVVDEDLDDRGDAPPARRRRRSPFPGLVEFDAADVARLALDAADRGHDRRRAADHRRRHHQPAGEHGRVGPRHG